VKRPSASSGATLPELDALRGAAVLLVFVQHLGDRFRPLWERWLGEGFALSLLRHAHVGVDIFFVVSGFSLAQGYVRAFEKSEAGPRAGAFFIRRALRILPAFYLAIALHLMLRPELFAKASLPAALAAHALLLQGYVAPGGIVLIGAAWSLTTEAGFYLALPLVARSLLAPPRSLRPWVIGAAICVGAWTLRGALHDAVLEPGRVTGLLEATQRRFVLARFDQFTLGALAALAYSRFGNSLKKAWIGAPLSLIGLAFALRLEGALYLEPGGSWPYALVSISIALFVLFTVAADRAFGRPRLLAKLGIVSYGIFLYHQLALDRVGAFLPPPDDAIRMIEIALVSLVISIGLGALSFRFVELPAIAFARRLTSPRPRELQDAPSFS
jgi:peptidoglycan/LPS O-acetylase OafA/YrhL